MLPLGVITSAEAPEKAPGPRDFFGFGVRVAPVAGALGYKSARPYTTFLGRAQARSEAQRLVRPQNQDAGLKPGATQPRRSRLCPVEPPVVSGG
jgi:hypothetical protein